MKKERRLRKRKPNDTEDKESITEDHASVTSCLKDIRALQKRRAQKVSQDRQSSLLPEQGQKCGEEKDVLDAYVKETSMIKTSETEEMDRYIAYHMQQRLGRSKGEKSKKLAPEEQRDKELFAVPENLKTSGAQEVSIPGLMTGISEVHLPMSCRLKNIEDTERAKAAILETGSLERLKPKKRRTQEQEEEEATGIKRSMFASSFGRVRRR